MFSGFVKSIPIEIEEAAMIDGCTPIQTFFRVVFSCYETNLCNRSDSSDDVDMERLFASVPCTEYKKYKTIQELRFNIFAEATVLLIWAL